MSLYLLYIHGSSAARQPEVSLRDSGLVHSGSDLYNYIGMAQSKHIPLRPRSAKFSQLKFKPSSAFPNEPSRSQESQISAVLEDLSDYDASRGGLLSPH